MNIRKVIAFGKSSFVISLPGTWLKKNRVKKGDVVFVEEDGNSVRIFTEEQDIETEEDLVVINIDKKSSKRVRREICSAFVNGCSTLVVEGKELEDRSVEMVNVINGLFALEIVEQSGRKIMAKDVLRKNEVKITDYVRRADNIVRSMLIDLGNPKFKDYKELGARQKQVIRIYLLLLKTFKSILYDERASNKLKITSEELLQNYRYVLSLQKISRAIRFIANYMNDVQDKKLISFFINKYLEHYVMVMNVFYRKNKKKAFDLGEWRKEALEDIQNRIVEGKYMLYAREKLVRMYSELHEIIHSIYN